MKRIVSYEHGESTVEVRLPKILTAGETEVSEVRLTGTGTDLEVEEVSLAFEPRYRTEDGVRGTTIERFTLASDLSSGAGLDDTRKTQIPVPEVVPGTYGSINVLGKVKFVTDRRTVEREAFLDVEPTERDRAVFDAVIDYGFALRDVECRVDESSGGRPFIQTFDFRPANPGLNERLERLELFIRTNRDESTLTVAIDREGLSPVPRSDESKTVVRSTDLERVERQVRSLVERNL